MVFDAAVHTGGVNHASPAAMRLGTMENNA
ncbi:hypothetical protein RLDS_12130 [Sphingobium lactosutens DS20]|uniref:Uncharacterized protein n=1 Tax=Sphingobium lactosutens DS20 TaxID=1331060 RepID=T0HEZ4_9SPHN|nr:hypothetical protein RLDS_12130 [Sphingobium lactosutens DS20]